MSSRLLALPFAALCCTAPVAQSTIVVDVTGGPGTQFTSIASALAAAAPGDTLAIRAGTYQEHRLSVTRGVSLIGVGGLVRIETSLLGLVISDLPDGETVALRDLSVIHSSPVGANGTIRIQDCRGLVAAEGLVATMGSGAPALVVQAIDSRQVHIANCQLTGISAFMSDLVVTSSTVTAPLLPAQFTDSHAVLVDTAISNTASTTGNWPMRITGGSVQLTRSTVENLGRPSLFPGESEAIQAERCTVVLDPSTVLVPRPGSPSIGGGGTVQQQEIASATVATSATTIDLELDYLANALYATLLSFPAGVTPSPFGPLWIDVANNLPIASGTLTNDLERLSIPHAGIPTGLVLTAQPFFLGASLAVGNGVAIVFP